MAMRFTVLASGSQGNACLLEVGGQGLLIDAGLGPRTLAERLAEVGSCWSRIGAVVLTHTHGDHWNERTLVHLARQRIPLFCHPEHRAVLASASEALADLETAQLVSLYAANTWSSLPLPIRCLPLLLRHAGATFGFRFEATTDLYGQSQRLGYLADLGSWPADLPDRLADLDLLALEFNHDVRLQKASGRPRRLIARNLGDWGHLSNAQAADLLRKVLSRTATGRLKHVVQLHVSRECNRPHLAMQAAREALTTSAHSVQIHLAQQDRPGPIIALQPARALPRPARPRRVVRSIFAGPWLPGLEPV